MSIIGKQYMGRVNLATEAQEVDNTPTTVLTRDAVTGDVRLTPVSFFPSNADIDGLNLAVNQAAAMLMLRNASNVVLSTVNLGFLNNEGTTFFYNETTEELELRNDAGEVLSSIPVSAFVSNLIQSVNFNSGTPYRLEFKDASGDVVDFVDITASNVQGAAADADVIHKDNTTEAKQGILLAGALISQNESSDNKISLQAGLAVPNIQFSNFADTVGKAGKINGSGGILGIGKNPRTGFMLDVLNTLGADKIIVGSDTDTGEAVQVTGQVKFDLYNLPNSTPGITIYTKSSPASPYALRVVNKDTDEHIFSVSKNGLTIGKFLQSPQYINSPRAVIRPIGNPDTGEALQVEGDGVIEGGLKVADAPTDPTDVVRLQDLGIKTTASTSSTVVINPNTETSYRLNAGVTDVTLPPLENNEGKILFLINNTGSNVSVNSNTGGNDIWDGGSSESTTVLAASVPMRLLHDGTQWIIL